MTHQELTEMARHHANNVLQRINVLRAAADTVADRGMLGADHATLHHLKALQRTIMTCSMHLTMTHALITQLVQDIEENHH